MAAAITMSNVLHYGMATASVSGDSANTARTIQINHPTGHVESHSVTTNGSGAASVSFVPPTTGTFTATLLTVPTVVATSASTNCKQQ